MLEGASLSYGTMPWFCHWASRVVQNHWRGTRGKETELSRSGKHEVGTKIASFPQGREGLALQSDEKTGSSGLCEVGQGGRDLCCHNAG